MKEDKDPWFWGFARLAWELGVSKATAKRWVKAGIFPAPEHYGPQIRRWSRSTVEAWKADRAHAQQTHAGAMTPLDTGEHLHTGQIRAMLATMRNETFELEDLVIVAGVSDLTVHGAAKLGVIRLPDGGTFSKPEALEALEALFERHPELSPFRTGNKTSQCCIRQSFPGLAFDLLKEVSK